MASGQQVNFHKSQVVVSSQLNGHKVASLLGMRLTALPIKYLGASLHHGVSCSMYCTSLLNHFDACLAGWANKLLSAAGRLTLIQSVLSAIPLHLFVVSRLPKSVVSELECKLAGLFWAERHHWRSLKHICVPVIEGGLGVRQLASLQKA